LRSKLSHDLLNKLFKVLLIWINPTIHSNAKYLEKYWISKNLPLNLSFWTHQFLTSDGSNSDDMNMNHNQNETKGWTRIPWNHHCLNPNLIYKMIAQRYHVQSVYCEVVVTSSDTTKYMLINNVLKTSPVIRCIQHLMDIVLSGCVNHRNTHQWVPWNNHNNYQMEFQLVLHLAPTRVIIEMLLLDHFYCHYVCIEH
jgi:hypothetical protein